MWGCWIQKQVETSKWATKSLLKWLVTLFSLAYSSRKCSLYWAVSYRTYTLKARCVRDDFVKLRHCSIDEMRIISLCIYICALSICTSPFHFYQWFRPQNMFLSVRSSVDRSRWVTAAGDRHTYAAARDSAASSPLFLYSSLFLYASLLLLAVVRLSCLFVRIDWRWLGAHFGAARSPFASAHTLTRLAYSSAQRLAGWVADWLTRFACPSIGPPLAIGACSLTRSASAAATVAIAAVARSSATVATVVSLQCESAAAAVVNGKCVMMLMRQCC